MSKHHATRLRNWTSLLILLHLLASLLPVGTAHAAVRATNCPESSLAARAAAVVPAANQQVLPRAVSGDEFLHAMLFGDQRLMDDSQILQSYALSATQPITGTDLLINPRLLINQVADQRTTAFAGMLDDYLAAIATNDHAEAADYIANTRRALGLTMRIVQTASEPATGVERVYLPFVTR